ncbi:MAG TPA: hypothetical protein VIZ43_28980 [Trebonia sp.]
MNGFATRRSTCTPVARSVSREIPARSATMAAVSRSPPTAVREFLGFKALRRVELHLEAQTGVGPAPLTVNALVLVDVPQVLDLDRLEAFGLEPVNVCENAVSVAFRTVREREPYAVGHLVDGLSSREVRIHQEHVRELFL